MAQKNAFGWTVAGSVDGRACTFTKIVRAEGGPRDVNLTFGSLSPFARDPLKEGKQEGWMLVISQRCMDEFPGTLEAPPFEQAEQSELKYFRNGLFTERFQPGHEGDRRYKQVLTGAGWKDLC